MVRLTVVICALGGSLALAGCSTVGKGASDTALMTRHGFRDAMAAPLKDFGLVKAKIPAILLEAEAEPYKLPVRMDCSGLAHEIARLDLALGPDIDIPREASKPTMLVRGSRAASDAALDAVRDLTTGWIPFRSTVRRLTGAADNQDDVEDAVQAGSLRRAYLKGLGLQAGCAHPAAPLPSQIQESVIAAGTPARPQGRPAHDGGVVRTGQPAAADAAAPAQAAPIAATVPAAPGL